MAKQGHSNDKQVEFEEDADLRSPSKLSLGSDLDVKKYHKGNFHHLVKIKENMERDRRN